MTSWTLPDALNLLHRQFPDAFVTSGKRDPNSALGKANPRSYHNIGEAFDIRPMQGVDFNDYVARLKAAGLPIVEALDEAKHPVGWTTGPNWHVAFSGQEKEDKRPMLTPEQRAAMFNVDIPGEDPQPFNIQKAMTLMPAAFGASGSQIPSGDFSAELAANAAKGEQQKKIPTWAKILGVISDAYINANGGKGQFAPTVRDFREREQEANLSREKLQTQLDAQQAALRYKLANPAQTQTDRYVAEIMDPNTDPRRKAILRQIVMRPIAVPTYNADGSQSMNFYYPDSLPQQGGGEDDWEYSN